MEKPTDYSRIYCEGPMKMDGTKIKKRTTERPECVDLVAVARKLKNLPSETDRHAIEALNRHYMDFKRRDQFKVYLQYFEDKETYVIRTNEPSLKAIKEKLPKRGAYRYFFQQPDKTLEEIEMDEVSVPYHDKQGLRQIFCQIFPDKRTCNKPLI